MAKLGEVSHATLFSACIRRVTSEQHVPRVAETRNVSVVSQKHLVSLAANFVTRYKVSEVAKLEDVEGKCYA